MAKDLIENFEDKEYRHDYTEAFFDTLIGAQIRALRKKLGWTQGRLGKATGTTQSGISAFESSDYSRWSVNTLRRFARVFDVALVVKFASFGEALKEIEGFDDASILLPVFSEESDASIEFDSVGTKIEEPISFLAGKVSRQIVVRQINSDGESRDA